MTFPMSSPIRPSSETPTASEPFEEAATAPSSAAMLRDPTRLPLHCERCGYDWFSRTASPVRCPKCASKSWNKGRVYKIEGKPDPTRKPKPRGQVFTSESAQEAAQIRHHGESEGKDKAKPPSTAEKES